MLTRRNLRQTMLLPPGLHLQERDESVYLLLHRLEPNERVELGLQLGERTRRFLPGAEALGDELLYLRSSRPPQLVADRPKGPAQLVERSHAGTVARATRAGVSAGRSALLHGPL